MDLENKKDLEGTETDNTLEATSASDEVIDDVPVTEPVPELNNSPTPTVDEVEDAGLTPEVEEVPDTPVIPEENVDKVVEENGVTDTPAIRSFTQEEVNDITGRTRIETRQKTFSYIYDRYGVQDEAGLDELVGNAQRYDSLQEQYDADKKGWKEQHDAREKELVDIKEQLALMQSGIDSSRYDDAKLILRGKGLEVSLDNINNELVTHPEWKKVEAPANDNFMKVDDTKPQNDLSEPESKISVLGNDSSKSPVDDEEAAAMRLFKV